MELLMTDPVILPSSRVTVDRSVITRLLLSNPIDPFNRTPLSEEDLIPNEALKQRIMAFISKSTNAASESISSTSSLDQTSPASSSDTSPTTSAVIAFFDSSSADLPPPSTLSADLVIAQSSGDNPSSYVSHPFSTEPYHSAEHEAGDY